MRLPGSFPGAGNNVEIIQTGSGEWMKIYKRKGQLKAAPFNILDKSF